MGQNGSLISVVIPAYNRADKIEAAVKSVQDQTYSNLEIVISDDGSTDNTKDVVTAMMAQDSRIHYIKAEANRGAQAARNAGIKAARVPALVADGRPALGLRDFFDIRTHEVLQPLGVRR